MKNVKIKRKFNIGDKVLLNDRFDESGVIKNKIYTIEEVHTMFPLIRLHGIADNWYLENNFNKNIKKIRKLKLNQLFEND